MAQTPEEVAAKAALDAELSAYWQRAAGQQRTRIETSKLLATVTLGLTGTLLGTALQVRAEGALVVLSCVLLAISLLGLLAIIAIDQTYEPDVDDMIAASTTSDSTTLMNIQTAMRHTLRSNDKTVKVIGLFSLASIAFAVGSACLAISSLLGG